jgi:hypothetical protein
MKWFKHLSGSLKDSVIFEAVELYGSDAYLVFFGTLEMLADEYDLDNPGSVRLSIKKMTSFFQLSRQKTVRILQHFDQIANKQADKSVSFFVQFENDHILVTCPKFKAICDEYTRKFNKKLSGVSPELVRKKSPLEVEVEEDKEEDKRKKKPPISPNGGFELFWKSYPRKESKGAAEKAWLKLKPGKELLEKILLSIEQHKKIEQWTKDNGAFIPYAQKFLNNKYYEDEVKVVSKSDFSRPWIKPGGKDD